MCGYSIPILFQDWQNAWVHLVILTILYSYLNISVPNTNLINAGEAPLGRRDTDWMENREECMLNMHEG